MKQIKLCTNDVIVLFRINWGFFLNPFKKEIRGRRNLLVIKCSHESLTHSNLTKILKHCSNSST